jgi:hypothetical protein
MHPLYRLASLSLFVAATAVAAEKPAPAKPSTPPVLVVPAVPAVPGAPGAPGEPKLTPPQKAAQEKGTHEKLRTIDVARKGQLSLQTLTVDAKGRVLGLVGASRYFNPGASKEKVTSEVHVFNSEGKSEGVWKVEFNAQSINTAPDGSIFVAGDGKVAKYSSDGKLLASLELPHLKKLLEDKEGLRKEAQAQLDQQKKSFQQSFDNVKKMKEKLEAIEEGKRTALQKNQLKQYESIIKSYEQTLKYYENQKVDDIVASTLSRLRIINGVAASKKDIFIACGEPKGYGYAVWRMSHDFKDAKLVISGGRGCCGQFDIQVQGEELLVAENTNHRWARFTRDGKLVSAHGKRGNDTDVECFGGCCNPMNVRANAAGDVYTAESEGIIKRFSSKGDFLNVVGYAPLTGGCKNVGVGASPDGEIVYFCDQPGSRIIVMKKKAAKSEPAESKKPEKPDTSESKK